MCVGSRASKAQGTKVEPRLNPCLLKKVALITFGCPMSHAQPRLLDLHFHAQLTSTPSVLLTSHRNNHCEERSLADLPNNPPLQVMSPSISFKWAIRRLSRYSSSGEQAELRLENQARTPLQPLSTRRLMTHRLWNAGFTTVQTVEREASADRSQVYVPLKGKTCCQTRSDFTPVRGDPSL